MIDFILEILLKPFFSEKLRVLKYYDQKYTAKRLLSSSSSRKMKKGLSLLFELATSYPYRVQEIINEITEFLRQKFPQGNPVNTQQKEVLESWAFVPLQPFRVLIRIDFPMTLIFIKSELKT